MSLLRITTVALLVALVIVPRTMFTSVLPLDQFFFVQRHNLSLQKSGAAILQ